MNQTYNSPTHPGTAGHYAYIDCIRGYAVLLVITCHLTDAFPNLPYPVHRLTVIGWHGVQLFFIASAVTLLMSWHAEKNRKGKNDILAFFIRRFCRIAPAYYGAILLYLLGCMTFLNDWHPSMATGVPNPWQAVPGAWSISAEFSFYVIFPILATIVTSLRRAAIMFLVTLLAAVTLNELGRRVFDESYGSQTMVDFLYYWLPNQAPVFALGFIVFFLLNVFSEQRRWVNTARFRMSALAAALGLYVGVTYLHAPMIFSYATVQPPALLQASIGFVLLVLVASTSPSGYLVNRYIAAVGKVSFSAYLVHFAVIDAFSTAEWAAGFRDQRNYAAILAYGVGWIGVAAVTVGLSAISHHLVEKPGIAIGKKLIDMLRVNPAHPALT